MNKFSIQDKEFEIINEIGNINIKGQFVVDSMKLLSETGNGEARLYIGPQNTKSLEDFFQYNQKSKIADINYFGKKFKEITNKCFVLKSDLIQYLKDAKVEYDLQEQEYKNDISRYWKENKKKIEDLSEEKIFFSIHDVSDKNKSDLQRFYIRSLDPIWRLIREISLPLLTYISIYKIKDENDQIFYYFKYFLDYDYNPINHPKIIEEIEEQIKQSSLNKNKKENILQARKGQGKYRDKLIEEMPYCPITRVTDERLLIASHIKPWSKSNEKEKVDPKNGFMFTPTFDKLFDRGFITFDDKGSIIISSWISPMNIKRLNLRNSITIDSHLVKGREKYLIYHRSYLFKQ